MATNPFQAATEFFSDAGEWLGDRFSLPSTDTPAPPGLTADQKEIQALILSESKKDIEFNNQLMPLILAGFGAIQDPDGTVRLMTEAEKDASLTADQRSLQALGRSQIDTAFLNMGLAYDPETNTTRPLTEDELFLRMTPQEQRTYGITNDLQASLEAAIAGDYSDPALEAQIEKQQGISEEELSRRLGPNWRLSTPGIQTEAERLKGANIARGVSNVNRISSISNILAGRAGLNLAEEQFDLGAFGATSGIQNRDVTTQAGLFSNAATFGGNEFAGLFGVNSLQQNQSDLEFSTMLQSSVNKQNQFAALLGLGGKAGSLAAILALNKK